jgi:hypothetical protein
MTPSQFFSPDPNARIEPVDFMRHFLVQRGLDAISVGLRQTVIVPLIPALERRLLRVLGAPEPQPHPIQHQALYHPAEVGALLVVSDECYHPVWKPGFGASRLRQACDEAVTVAVAAASV